ncbi:MAG: pitrilysin family protein, partial [Tepidisphaeraceae bacterium]
MTFHRTRLANGLQIIAEASPDAHSFAAGFYVNTGSRDESADINGVSHFLEHVMFKGSGKYTWEDVNRIFDEMGANYNAYTSQENTAYFANVLPEFTQAAIEHLSYLLRPAIRQEDFDAEKKVILEEIAMYLDDPGHRIYES